MPPRAIVQASTTFGERLPAALRYPLHPAALTSIVTIAFAHYLAWVPVLGLVFTLICWAAMYRYAFECLLQTADGYADPPEFAMEERNTEAAVLIAVQMVAVLYMILMPAWLGPGALVFGALLVFFLPAIAMSLAFDGNALGALNPINWFRTVHRFGAPYFLMAGIYIAIGAVQILLQHTVTGILPRMLSMLAYYLVANYATVLNFHLMGALIHAHADRIGHSPKAEMEQRQLGLGVDDELMRVVEAAASTDPAAAIDMLTERLREGLAPAAVHTEYRRLLKLAGRRDELLVHGQIWIASLIVAGDLRKALGVVQECQEIDPRFLPDDPRTTGPLAERASGLGMPRLARQLALGYVQTWPREYEAPYYGLLAARTMVDLNQRTEALVLLARLRIAWPDHPMTPQIDALSAQLEPPHVLPSA